MRTSLDIPDELLDEAKEVARTKTKTQAVILALTELIQRRKSKRILDLKGTMDSDYDYRPTRKKR